MRFPTVRFVVFVATTLLPGLASAQIGSPLNCSSTSPNSPPLRAEGVNDLISDIVVSCTGGSTAQYGAFQPLPTAAFTVSLPANVTSRLLNTSVAPNISEALLLVDEPGSGLPAYVPGSGSQAPQTVCSSATLGAAPGGCPQYPVAVGTATVMSSAPGSVTAPANIYQGLWNPSIPNQIAFPAVPILAPVNPAVTRIYRITNIRVNVSTVTPGGSGGPAPLLASVFANGAISLSATAQIAGYVVTGLSAATRNLANTGSLSPPIFSPCQGTGGTVPVPVGLLQFTENFATAFKTGGQPSSGIAGGQQPVLAQNVPGTVYNTESGFTIRTPNGIAGLADYGTRLKAVFHGVPSGFRLFVSVNNVVNSSTPISGASPTAAMVTSETVSDIPTEGVPPSPTVSTWVAGIPTAEIIPDSTGTAMAVWESLSNSPTAIDQYEFVVYVLGVGTGTTTVNLSYAPTPPAGASQSVLNAWAMGSSTLTLPRFVDRSAAQVVFGTAMPGGCFAPQLTVSKSHSGIFVSGGAGGLFTIIVGDLVVATSGTVTVVDSMPAGLTALAISGSGWSCGLANLTCTRGDSLSAGTSYPPILINASVASGAVSPQVNMVTVSGGGSTSAAATDAVYLGLGPPPVTSFSPANGATGVASNVTLIWGASAGASSYQLYLGTAQPPPLYATLYGTSDSVSLNPGTTYYWSVTATNSLGSTASATQTFTTTTGTGGSLFVPVTPCRVMDTRNSTGTFGGPYLAAGSTRTIPIPAGGCNIPASATAYSLNVTVLPHAGLNYLTVWPAGQAQPYVSTLNSLNGAVTANAAIVPAGSAANGYGISVYASDDTDVVIDINGYFTPASTTGALAFYLLTPCRVVDTRIPASPFGSYLAGGSTRSFAIPSGPCGVPGSAQAYSLNITVVPHGPLQYLSVWPQGTAQPYVSTLNAPSGAVVANAAIVPAGGPFAGPGGIDVYATADTDLVIDINGYFAAAGGSGALAFYPLTPCRVADTRNSVLGPIAGNTSQAFTIEGACGAPAAAQAFALNVTAVPSGPLNYLTIWPLGQTQPLVSTLNSPTGTAVANAAIVAEGNAGVLTAIPWIYVYASNTTHVVIDINGYFGQ